MCIATAAKTTAVTASDSAAPTTTTNKKTDEQLEYKYSRKNIPGDKVIPAFHAVGWERQVYLVIYSCICTASISGALYVGFHDLKLLCISLLCAYFANNLGFSMAHTILHMQFIEQREQDMYRLVHHSFIHHYRDTQVYHKTWLETRLSYFLDGRTPWRIIASANSWHWFLAMPTVAMKFSPTPLHAICAMSTFVLMQSLQSICHEWYHVPERQRQSFYWPPTYYMLYTLESLGVLSTQRHKLHHQHNLNNLDDVDEWTDMWSFSWFEKLSNWIFQRKLQQYQPGKEIMYKSMDPIIALLAVVVNGIIQSGVWFHYNYFYNNSM